MKALIASFRLLVATASAQIAMADSPVSELPSEISPPAGRLSLIADFGSSKPGRPIVVYLVNNSVHDLRLRAQEGDVFLKLETMTDSGSWRRAQPHTFSMCGTSYSFSPVVRKSHFIKIDGYQPPKGRKTKIRFRLYLQEGLDLVSQAGDGNVLDADITQASSDAMAINTGDLNFVASVALGDKILKNPSEPFIDLQDRAIDTLMSDRFPADKIVSLLDELAPRFPELKDLIARVRNHATSRTKQAEPGGAGQPATRSESDSEDSDKPQPESEGRSQ